MDKKEYAQNYRKNNKEKIKANNKSYYERVRKYKNREICLKWRQENRERYLLTKGLYRRTEKSKEYVKNRSWNVRNKEEYRACLRASNKKRYKAVGDLSVSDRQRIYEDNINKYGTLTCVLCKKKVAFGDDCIDHLTPICRGGSGEFNNIGVAHRKCNAIKNTKTLSEWLALDPRLRTI